MSRVLKRILATVSVLAGLGLITGTSALAQTPPDVSGTWRGTLVAAQYDPIEIVFHIEGSASGYSATLDIPAQARTGVRVDSVSIRGSNIMIRMNGIQAEYYAGLVRAEDGISIEALDGDWGQSGEHTPLRMLREP
ncbi:MAG: hypothetical protein Q7W55_06825 [Pseudohongiella sp.]|nr:hypothetical protein [Pseudohongiella sp.]MDO9520049.1 hypothetical protein [Pseudohongiella sp.]MDP2127954.1 hypothetical protein [Pseudohongiella sp.]